MMKTAIKHKSRHFRRFLKANEAVAAMEYAVLVGIIIVGVGGAAVLFGERIETGLENIGKQVTKQANKAAKGG